MLGYIAAAFAAPAAPATRRCYHTCCRLKLVLVLFARYCPVRRNLSAAAAAVAVQL